MHLLQWPLNLHWSASMNDPATQVPVSVSRNAKIASGGGYRRRDGHWEFLSIVYIFTHLLFSDRFCQGFCPKHHSFSDAGSTVLVSTRVIHRSLFSSGGRTSRAPQAVQLSDSMKRKEVSSGLGVTSSSSVETIK